MAKIVLSTFGSLGDVHPKIALGLELRERGHQVVFNVMEAFREKFATLGFEISPLRPNLDPEDRELAKTIMGERGSEFIFKQVFLPNLRPMFEDMMTAVAGADLLITGEVVLPTRSVVEKTGIKWVSTSLAPISFLSTIDPSVYPNAVFLDHFRFMPQFFHELILGQARRMFREWFKPYREFRRELGLNEDHDPMFGDKYSQLLHLAMFSRALAEPQEDWKGATIQTGFCFYDGKEDMGAMPEELEKFLSSGEAPIVFTLGSAAVMDPRDFYEQSIRAAKILQKRAVMLYGIFNQPPTGLDDQRVGFDYAPYGQLFSRASVVVHQGGVGTTSQVLRAGVPMIVMPYSHDQPDNAARCRRLGVAEVVSRDDYNADTISAKLRKIINDNSYRENARRAKSIVDSEDGTRSACDAIEQVLE